MSACGLTLGPLRLAVVALAATFAGSPASASSASQPAISSDRALAISRAAVGRSLGDHVFYETSGQPVAMRTLRGKPLLVSLIYTSCDHSCTVATRALARNVRVAREALGDESFGVVTIGFDTAADSPSRMREYARSQGVDMPGWRFLSGDAATLEALIDDVGFTYEATPRGYDHIAQATLVDADGRVYRQIYGDRFDPPALVEPLKELVFDRPVNASLVSNWVDGLKLLCTIYDPAAGRYRFDNSVWVALGVGVMCLGSLGFILARAWTGERKRAAQD